MRVLSESECDVSVTPRARARVCASENEVGRDGYARERGREREGGKERESKTVKLAM